MVQGVNKSIINKIFPIVQTIRLYHRHELINIKSIPKKSGAIIAVNHSLATYDIILLGGAIYEKYRRVPFSLIDKTFYKFPLLVDFMEKLGAVKGTQENAIKVLKKNNLIMVAPGGMRESLKPSRDKYKIYWNKRKGFVKLALLSQKPIILAACPFADDVYDVYPSELTKWVYTSFKLPMPFLRGIGLTAIPRPVKLTHTLSKPIRPPKLKESEITDKVIDDFHKIVVTEMNKLIKQVLKKNKIDNSTKK